MRSPGAAFDLRAAMTQELNAAVQELDAGKPEALHRCRVRLRRARTLGRIGKEVAPGLAAVFDDSARGVMRQLGQARDLSALAETARMLAELSRKKTAAALIAMADGLESAREALPKLDLNSVRAGIRDLHALAQVWPEPSARQIRAGAQRLAKRARRAFRNGRGADDPTLRHEWRKREKDRLYAVTLLEHHWPRARRRKQTEALSHLLGRERDGLLLLQRLGREPSLSGDEDQAKRASRALRKYCARLRRRADQLGAQLHAGGA